MPVISQDSLFTAIPGLMIDPWTSALVRGDSSAVLSKSELLLLKRLLQGWTSSEELCSTISTSTKLSTLRVTLSRLRMKLVPLHLQIIPHAGGYHIKETELAHPNT